MTGVPTQPFRLYSLAGGPPGLVGSGGLNRLRKDEWFLRNGDKERTAGLKARCFAAFVYGLKPVPTSPYLPARTYPHVISGLSFSAACKAAFI
jgi:hypothetical protein